MPTGALVTPSGMMYEKMVEDEDARGYRWQCHRGHPQAFVRHIVRLSCISSASVRTSTPLSTPTSRTQLRFRSFRVLIEFRVCITVLATPPRHAGSHPISGYGSIDMGIDTVKYVGNGHAVILSQHGVMTVGKDSIRRFTLRSTSKKPQNAIWLLSGLRQRRDQR